MGELALLFGVALPLLAAVTVGSAAGVALAWFALPESSSRTVYAAAFGLGLVGVVYRCWQTVHWWQGSAPASVGRSAWSLSDPYDPDLRRGAIAETVVIVALYAAAGVLVGTEQRGTPGWLPGLLATMLGGTIALWISVAGFGRPRWLLPGDARRRATRGGASTRAQLVEQRRPVGRRRSPSRRAGRRAGR